MSRVIHLTGIVNQNASDLTAYFVYETDNMVCCETVRGVCHMKKKNRIIFSLQKCLFGFKKIDGFHILSVILLSFSPWGHPKGSAIHRHRETAAVNTLHRHPAKTCRQNEFITCSFKETRRTIYLKQTYFFLEQTRAIIYASVHSQGKKFL